MLLATMCSLLIPWVSKDKRVQLVAFCCFLLAPFVCRFLRQPCSSKSSMHVCSCGVPMCWLAQARPGLMLTKSTSGPHAKERETTEPTQGACENWDHALCRTETKHMWTTLLGLSYHKLSVGVALSCPCPLLAPSRLA